MFSSYTIADICDVALCGLVEIDWRFRRNFCLHHQGEDRHFLERHSICARLHKTASQKSNNLYCSPWEHQISRWIHFTRFWTLLTHAVRDVWNKVVVNRNRIKRPHEPLMTEPLQVSGIRITLLTEPLQGERIRITWLTEPLQRERIRITWLT
jgi:hypothetical protein